MSEFDQGVAWAATLIAPVCQTTAIEVLDGAGLTTIDALSAAGVAEQDIEALRGIVEVHQRNMKARADIAARLRTAGEE